jgi:hypothetical protein
MLLDLNGNVLSSLKPKVETESSMDALKREAEEIADLFPGLQKKAYNKRLVEGPFSEDVYESGPYLIEYSFEEQEDTPQLFAIFKEDRLYSSDFIELVFTIVQRRSVLALLGAVEDKVLPEDPSTLDRANNLLATIDKSLQKVHNDNSRQKAARVKSKLKNRKMK